MKNLTRAGLFGAISFIGISSLAACGGSTTTLGAADAASSEGSPATSAAVTVTVLMDLDRDGVITRSMETFGEQGWCSTGFVTLLDASGGQSVTLKVDGVDAPFTAKFKPAALNNEDLPCQAEATIPNVPSGAQSYVAAQTGSGVDNILAGKATITGKELETNANVINLE